MKREQKRRQRDAAFPHVRWTADVPIKYEADVAVIGGGIAGVCAACAAADSGASVTLVERFAAAGGVLTTGGVANFSGDTRGLGSIFDEILADLDKFHALGPLRDSPHDTKEQVFDHEILSLVLQEMLLRRKIRLLLHTRFVDASTSGNRITEIILCGASGPEALRAPVFIDCTGEGQVAYAAGYSTMKGRDSDGLTLAMSMMAFIRHVLPEEITSNALRNTGKNKIVPYAASQIPDGWLSAIKRKEDLPMVSVWPNGPRSNALKIKIPGCDSTDTESLTQAEIRGRRRFIQVIDYFQRVENQPWIIDHLSPIIGIREGRRIAGDYLLTLADVQAGRKFQDGVARGTWYLDAHSSDDDKRSYEVDLEDMGVPPYQIPLRALIAADGENLFMAGRCLSADYMALSSARVSPAGGMMGQAAGIAAAIAASGDGNARKVSAEKVRRIVTERGAVL